jgi:uncharacterized protein (TIGR03435 family)
MRTDVKSKLGICRNASAVAALFASATILCAQAPKMEFDVATIKQDKSDTRYYNSFAMGPGNAYNLNGGHFSAGGFPMWVYIQFAYKMTDHEIESLMKQLPRWALDEHYAIEAKTDNLNATKDDMRLMMRSLLADRLKLAVHTVTEEVSVYGLVLVKPGKLGPMLRVHSADDVTCSAAAVKQTAPDEAAPQGPHRLADGFPAHCGALAPLPPSAPGLVAIGYRNVPLKLITMQMTDLGALDRPVVDATGLTGNVDFVVEYARERPPDAPASDVDGPTFREALAKQAGLKLVPQKGELENIVIDHIERPSAN